MKQMLSMGGLSNLMDKLPGLGQIPQAMKSKVNDKEILKSLAILDSMTTQERHFPSLINGSRKRRIASGSGSQIQDIKST